jgi:hypothetical protein
MNSFRGSQNPEERDPGESKRATGAVTGHEGKVPIECYPVHADDVREGLKLAFEAVKHLTTLNAGSFVLLATFLKDIFHGELARGDKILVGSAFLCFAASLVFSAFSMWRLATLMRSRREYETKKTKIRWNIANPSGFYVLGLLFFGTAVLANVFYGDKVDNVPHVPLLEIPWVLFVPLVIFTLATALSFAIRLWRGRNRDKKVVYNVLYPSHGELGTLPPKEVIGYADAHSADESE